MDKEKIAEFKKNLKLTIKDHTPELIIAGSTVLGFAVYIAYVSRAIAKSSPDDVTITQGFGGSGLLITDPEDYAMLLKEPSTICYKLGDQHFSLAPNDCTDVH